MATLYEAITAAAALIAGLSGIREAPALPEEVLNVFPFAAIYPGGGEQTMPINRVRQDLGSIVIELHVARKDLPRDVEKAIPYVDSIPNVLFDGLDDNKWSATIDTFESITWTFGELGWNGQQTLGFRFIVNGVKRQIDVT
jgi:hypothetical protein